ncbi:MAG: methyltransferase type 12 [Alphaproteobacteria bacterium]|nr:methyltransferase type 12 [Alphaproteobacteria bacterium]
MTEAESLKANEIDDAWTFKSASVADKFDAHVREQLPWYDPLSRYVADIAVCFLPQGGTLYDIGASTGNVTRLMRNDLIAKRAATLSIEPSHDMANLFDGHGELLVIDGEHIDYARRRPDVAILFLTLMFMRPSERRGFIDKLLRSINPGGAVIIVDKEFIDVGPAAAAFKTALLASKLRAGMDEAAYVKKELALRGEQRPTSMREIILMADAKFEIQEFFRFGEFYGLLLIRQDV